MGCVGEFIVSVWIKQSSSNPYTVELAGGDALIDLSIKGKTLFVVKDLSTHIVALLS